MVLFRLFTGVGSGEGACPLPSALCYIMLQVLRLIGIVYNPRRSDVPIADLLSTHKDTTAAEAASPTSAINTTFRTIDQATFDLRFDLLEESDENSSSDDLHQ